jgi:diguanylate cyclase (GGDEF)-like protein/PAS domain S-box-containing protein
MFNDNNNDTTFTLVLMAALFLWFGDAALNSLLFHEGSFFDLLLLNIPNHSLTTRLLAVGIFAAFGAVITILRDSIELRKSRRASTWHRKQYEVQVSGRTAELEEVNELLRKEILERRRAEDGLQQSERFLSTIFESFHDPICIVDREARIVKFNDAYRHLRGKKPEELFRKKCYEALHQRSTWCDDCVVERTFSTSTSQTREKRVTANGSEIWIEVHTYPILDRTGAASHVIQYIRNITDRTTAEEEKNQLIRTLNHLSTADSLTGLLNRRALTEILLHEAERAQRYDGNLSVMLCDVDGLKAVNDTYGHTAGDWAIQAIAASLMRSLRKTDVVGRYGGDEFMIILPETSLDGARTIAEKICAAVNEIDLEVAPDRRIGLSLSIGIADSASAVDDIDFLVKLADSALYASKSRGKNRVSTAV